MSVSLSPPMFLQFFVPGTNQPAVGSQLFTYIANSSTKQATWTDSTQVTQNANPIIADANGVMIVWLDPTLLYKFVWAPKGDTDPPSSPIYSVDNISPNITGATLTAALIGSVLYPRILAEIAAAVTPTNFVYPPGDVRRYGAVLNGVTNDQAALVAAYAQGGQSGGSPVFIATGILLCATSTVTIPANVLTYGNGKYASIIKKGFNGDLFSWGSSSGFENVQINGNGTNFTGRSATIAASSFGQYADNCKWTNSSGYHVEYLGQDPGSNSYFISCDFDPTLVPTFGVAVKYSGTTDSQAVPRTIMNCHGGGAYLVDFGGANDSYFIGNFTNGMVWSSSATSHVFITGNRIALNGATLTVKGGETLLVCNSIAGPIVFDNTTVSCQFVGSSPGSGWSSITDNGTSNYIDIKQVGYTPTWTSSGGGAAIGNAAVVAQYSRSGNTVCVDIDIIVGSTTTFGSGFLQIGMPTTPASASQFMVGTVYLNHASSGLTTVGVAQQNPSTSVVNLQANGATAPVSGTVPWTWATGDRITLHVQYATP